MQTEQQGTEGLSLIPVTIVAFGPSEAPVERLIGLQSAIAKAVDWLISPRLPRLRFPSHAALRFHPTSHGDLS